MNKREEEEEEKRDFLYSFTRVYRKSKITSTFLFLFFLKNKISKNI